MEYALIFASMGTWILYREFKYWVVRGKYTEAMHLVAMLSLDKLGKSEGILKIEILDKDIFNKGE